MIYTLVIQLLSLTNNIQASTWNNLQILYFFVVVCGGGVLNGIIVGSQKKLNLHILKCVKQLFRFRSLFRLSHRYFIFSHEIFIAFFCAFYIYSIFCTCSFVCFLFVFKFNTNKIKQIKNINDLHFNYVAIDCRFVHVCYKYAMDQNRTRISNLAMQIDANINVNYMKNVHKW